MYEPLQLADSIFDSSCFYHLVLCHIWEVKALPKLIICLEGLKFKQQENKEEVNVDEMFYVPS